MDAEDELSNFTGDHEYVFEYRINVLHETDLQYVVERKDGIVLQYVRLVDKLHRTVYVFDTPQALA
jgi:hypothetical protein